MSEIRDIRDLMKNGQWGRLLGLWAAFLFALPPLWAAFATLLSMAAVSDIEKRIVPDTVCLTVAVLGLIQWITVEDCSLRRLLFMGAAVLLLRLARGIFRDGIGMGDVKLLLAASFLLSPVSLAFGMMTGCFLTAVAGLIRFRSLKGKMPLVPFLSLGLTISTFFSKTY